MDPLLAPAIVLLAMIVVPIVAFAIGWERGRVHGHWKALEILMKAREQKEAGDRPDAVIFHGPDGLAASEFWTRDNWEPLHGMAEQMLAIDREKGEKAWIRTQSIAQGLFFATRDQCDTMFFPKDHPLAGQPRYDWIERIDGTAVGTLRN